MIWYKKTTVNIVLFGVPLIMTTGERTKKTSGKGGKGMEVSNEAKKKFMSLIFKCGVFKSRDTIWLLNYLVSHSDFSNIDFVDGIYDCDENLLTIGLLGTHAPSMTLDIAGKKFTSESKIYEAFKRDGIFSNRGKLAVLFIIPPQNEIRKSPDYINALSLRNQPEEINKVLWEAENIARYNFINKQIDLALDSGDKKGFYHYTNELVKVYDEFLTLYDGEEHYEKS